jgi:hypothetical protein
MRTEQARPHMEHAIIADTPASFNEPVSVILPEFDNALTWGPCAWLAPNDTDKPHAGDDCLVAFSNRREPWIVAWWPSVAPAPSVRAPVSPSIITGYPSDVTKALRGDASWSKTPQLIWDSVAAGVTLPAASVSTPTIDSTWAHICVIWKARSAVASTGESFQMRVNGSSIAAYYNQTFRGIGANVTAFESLIQTSANIGAVPGSTAGSGNDFGTGVLWFPGATNLAGIGYIFFVGIYNHFTGTLTNQGQTGAVGGYYGSTPLTSITFLTASGSNIVAGSQFSVYGFPA